MDILKKPLVTEKSNAYAEQGTYAFLVDRRANKLTIKSAVEEMYGVTVDKVRTTILPGKPKSRNTKAGLLVGRTAMYKKAYVKLAGDDMIDFFDDGENTSEGNED